MNSAREIYETNLIALSDIKDHVPYFFDIAHGSILELGVRSGVSTSAFLFGLEEHRDGKLWSVDINPNCERLFRGHPNWKFICADSLELPKIVNAGVPCFLNIIFIDTQHDYDYVMQQLVSWSPFVDKDGVILVHDVVRFCNDAGRACGEFSTEYGWDLVVRAESNGLAIMKKEALREDT